MYISSNSILEVLSTDYKAVKRMHIKCLNKLEKDTTKIPKISAYLDLEINPLHLPVIKSIAIKIKTKQNKI